MVLVQGNLTRSKNKVPFDPFPPGVAIIKKFNAIAKHFHYGNKKEVLKSFLTLAKAPVRMPHVNLNSTRIQAIENLLNTCLITQGGWQMYAAVNNNIAAVQINPEEIDFGCEIEGILKEIGNFVISTQYEQYFTGAYRVISYNSLLLTFDAFEGQVHVISERPPLAENGIVRTALS